MDGGNTQEAMLLAVNSPEYHEIITIRQTKQKPPAARYERLEAFFIL